MTEQILKVEQVEAIALIGLNNPPVNALSADLRAATYKALQILRSDDAIKAIVIYGEGRFFSAGADIKDFGRATEKPTLPDLLKDINDSSKPIIVALHGIAFGGGLELALAAHVRVGVSGLRAALPEVKLGIIPGAGGTQRLPRLAGIRAAVDIICTGKEVSAEKALEIGILDRLTNDSARDAGIAAANDVLTGKIPANSTDGLSIAPASTVIDAARQKYTGGLKAPLRALESIEAATRPISEGLALEREIFLQLMQSDERAGLVHAFFAERATAKIPEQNAGLQEINSIGVIGGGTMGVGIASAFSIAGFPVTLIELQDEQLKRARTIIDLNLSGALKRGKMKQEAYEKTRDILHFSTNLTDLAKTDLVIEAVFEDMDVKTELFKQLDNICKPGAMLATNTSYLDVNTIAAATKRANDVIGLHFFSPAHIMRLLEVVVAEKTSPELVATSFNLARKIGKIPVRAGVCDGFIGNRILSRYRKCCEYMLLDGAEFDQIDSALESFGFAMGPFAVADLAGLDISYTTRKRKAKTRPVEERYVRIADLVYEQGWHGRKNGCGFYVYDDSKIRVPNPGARDIVTKERAMLGIEPQTFTDDDIVARCLTTMIQEAANVLDEGIALRPVDIDAVELFGYGFPRHRGGPLHMADQIGLDTIIDRIRTYAEEDDYFWRVPTLLKQMLSKNQTFADLNISPEK